MRSRNRLLVPVLLGGLVACSSASAQDGDDAAQTSGSEPQVYDASTVDWPDDVEVIREIAPGEDIAVYAQCLTEAGFEVEVAPGNQSYSYDTGGVQEQEEYALADYVCRQQYPIAEKYTEPLTEAQWGIIHSHWEQETIPCLTELGYSPDPLPPAEQLFAEHEALMAGTNSSDPYLVVGDDVYRAIEADVQEGRWEFVEEVTDEVCPIDPPLDVLYP